MPNLERYCNFERAGRFSYTVDARREQSARNVTVGGWQYAGLSSNLFWRTSDHLHRPDDQRARQFGEITPGQPALVAVLETCRPQLGVNKHKTLDDFMTKLNPPCVFTTSNSVPLPTPTLVTSVPAQLSLPLIITRVGPW